MTASRPSGSTHACTWPIDAADSGDSSKWRKICDGGRPRSLRIISRAVSPSNGGTSSRQRRAAFDSGAGKIPGDEAMSWPSFTKVGPERLERVDRALGRHRGPRALALAGELGRAAPARMQTVKVR